MTDFSLAGFLLSLAAAAALLIWSVRLVRTGVERAFGRQLRGWLARSAQSRLTAVISGLVAALLLQSATAVLALVAGLWAGAFSVAAGTAYSRGHKSFTRGKWRTRRDSNPWPLPSEGSALSS
jgi:phosphate:Na+ symporter